MKATIDSHAEILSAYEAATRRATESAGSSKPAIPREMALDSNLVLPNAPGAEVYRFEADPQPVPPDAARPSMLGGGPAADAIGEHGRAAAMLVRRAAEIDPAPSTATTPVGTLMPWAVQNDVSPHLATETLTIAARIAADPTSLTLRGYEQAAQVWLTITRDLNFAFDQHMQVEPIGLLHLERMSFVPAGIERGELEYSVPLSPDETVNISHKEWSNTSEEFEQIVTDYLEAYTSYEQRRSTSRASRLRPRRAPRTRRCASSRTRIPTRPRGSTTTSWCESGA